MRKRFVLGFAALGFLAGGIAAAGPGQVPDAGDPVTAALEPIRRKYGVPALAGAVVTGKGLEVLGATGVRKAGTDVAVTADDLWHLGSDTKAMTATLIGLLVEQGKLDWSTTIEKVFPDIAESLPPPVRAITVLELLSHNAGLPANLDWHQVSRSGSVREQRLDVVRKLAAIQLSSPPGTKFEYSNLGYVVAGAMAERVTGRSWEDLMTERVFGPLGMKSCGFGGTGTPGRIDQPWPHGADGKPTLLNGPFVDNPPVMGPAGTIHCSLADWAKFVADQLRGERGEKALVKTATYQKLHTPPFGGDYALGWLVTKRDWGGGTVWTHAGSNTMNFAVVWAAPPRDFAVLVCTNQGGDVAAKACDEAAAVLIAMHAKK